MDKDKLFSSLEEQHKLPSGLLNAVMMQESRGNANALSPKGAQGYFQFMPATAKQYGVNPSDLTSSATGAARMYADLLKQNNGDLDSALAGYNWGQGNLSKYGIGKAPKETRNYIAKVKQGMGGSGSMGGVGKMPEVEDLEALYAQAAPVEDLEALYAKAKPITDSPVIPDTPEIVKQKLAAAKQGLADVDNMKIEPPNTFARRVVQGASSGPIMGGVQMIADATGNKELSDKIAKNAREGNFLGSMMQPEAWLTGGAAGKFIGQGAKWYNQAARAGLMAAPYAATSVVANPSDDKVTDRAIQGAIGGTTAMVASPVLGGITRGSQYLIDAIRGRSGKVNAGKMARDVAGDAIDNIKALNANAPDNVTSAQATLDADRDVWQSLGKIAESKDKSSYYRMLGDKQRAGRIATLEAVKPDLKAAEAQRKTLSDPLYYAVRNNKSPVDTKPIISKVNKIIDENSGNPELVAAMNRVKSGLYDDAGNVVKDPKKISSIMDGIKSSMASKDNKFIVGQLTEIRQDIANALPGRVKADKVYSHLSKPVNQSKVIDAMIETLKPREGNSESSAALLNSLGKNENALIKRADQSPRFGGLDEILNVPQKSAKDKVVNELIVNEEVNRRALAGRGGAIDIAEGDKFKARFPSLIDAKFATANKVLDTIETKVNKKTMDAIVEGMKSGKNANEMLNTLPSGERIKVINALKNQKAIPYFSGVITGTQQQGEQ
jgi:hypothetical protein